MRSSTSSGRSIICMVGIDDIVFGKYNFESVVRCVQEFKGGDDPAAVGSTAPDSVSQACDTTTSQQNSSDFRVFTACATQAE